MFVPESSQRLQRVESDPTLMSRMGGKRTLRLSSEPVHQSREPTGRRSADSAEQRLPLGKGCRAALLEGASVDEVTFRVEVVVDVGMDACELLQARHSSEPEHRPFSSSKAQVR